MDQVEKVAEEFHNVWINEAIRQGRNDSTVVPWRDLAENIKKYDRELAGFVLSNFVRQPSGVDLNKILELKNKFALEAQTRTKELGDALEEIRRKESYIGHLQYQVDELKKENENLKAGIQGKVVRLMPEKRFNPARFKGAELIIISFFKEIAEQGHPICQIETASKQLHERKPKYSLQTYGRSIRKLGSPENPDRKLTRIRQGVYTINVESRTEILLE